MTSATVYMDVWEWWGSPTTIRISQIDDYGTLAASSADWNAAHNGGYQEEFSLNYTINPIGSQFSFSPAGSDVNTDSMTCFMFREKDHDVLGIAPTSQNGLSFAGPNAAVMTAPYMEVTLGRFGHTNRTLLGVG